MLPDTKHRFDTRWRRSGPTWQTSPRRPGRPVRRRRVCDRTGDQTAVFVDGAAFGLNLIERRPLPNTPGPIVLGDFEDLGRFVLPPTTLLQLRANIDAALQQYRAFFGSDPPGPEKLPTDAMDAARRSLLGNLPTQPPDPEAT